MSTMEELEQRKKELQLRSEIAKLEREQRVRGMVSNTAAWSWWWVGPLSVVALYFIIGGIARDKPEAAVLGLVFLVPLLLKVLGLRNA